MTKSEATRAFLAKEIQIYVDCLNFSLLNDVVTGGKEEHLFSEGAHLKRYFVNKGAGYEHYHIPQHPAPVVKLSEITEDETADVEVKHLTMRVSLEGVALCVEKDTKGFSTLELIAACVLMKEALDNEQAELTAGRDRPE